jgi:hypothetical protein
MGWKLQRVEKTAFLAAISLWFASVAWAGPALDQAQAGRSRAFNDFYRSYEASPSKTPEDVSALSQRTIGAASAATARAIGQESIQATKQAGIPLVTPSELPAYKSRVAERQHGSVERRSVASSEKSGAARADDAPVGPASQTTDSAPRGPEVVIDGSKIPKKIAF